MNFCTDKGRKTALFSKIKFFFGAEIDRREAPPPLKPWRRIVNMRFTGEKGARIFISYLSNMKIKSLNEV